MQETMRRASLAICHNTVYRRKIRSIKCLDGQRENISRSNGRLIWVDHSLKKAEYWTNLPHDRIFAQVCHKSTERKDLHGRHTPNALSLWREAGCPCAPYLKARVQRGINEYSSTVDVIKSHEKDLLFALPARPGIGRSHRRSSPETGRLQRTAQRHRACTARQEEVESHQAPAR